MKSIFHSALDVIFPKFCVGCESILLDNENLLCSFCRYEMPRTNFLQYHKNAAYKKFYGIVTVHKAAALLYYEKTGITQRILHHLKYKNKPEIGILLANMFFDDLEYYNYFEPNSCLIPIPLHKKRLRERGYNQTLLFTEVLAKNHNLEIDTQSLTRTVYNKTQTKKNLEERQAYNMSMFNLESNNLENRHLVLVDDVLTTGSTLIQCIKVLNKIPNTKISVLTMAYANG